MALRSPLRDLIRDSRRLLDPLLPEPVAWAGFFNLACQFLSALPPPIPASAEWPAQLRQQILERFHAPALASAWQAEETLGWLYQFWNEPRKDEIFARSGGGKTKIPAAGLAAVTQRFTPAWMARLLVENSLGRLWLRLHPASRLAKHMPYLVSLPPTPATAEPCLARQITLLDPACGCMHFGLAAFDLLAAIYREELECAGKPGWPAVASVASSAHIPAAILEHNLFGLDIDPRAVSLAAAALTLRAYRLEPTIVLPAPNLQTLPAPTGSLIDFPGPASFDCVLTNPPFLSRRSIEPTLAGFLRQRFPAARGDLYAAFLLRCLELCRPGGYVGLVAQQSFMFLPSYRALRKEVLETSAVEVLAQAGPHAFEEITGEKVNAAAFVLHRPPPASPAGVFFRLDDLPDSDSKRQVFEQSLASHRSGQPHRRVFSQPRETLLQPPGSPWAYWVPASIRAILSQFSTLLALPGTDGHKTAANARFIRPESELSAAQLASGDWLPLARPLAQVPYQQCFPQRVNWSAEARAFYHANPTSSPLDPRHLNHPGICWSRVASRRFNARRLPAGVVPDVSTPAIYPPEENLLPLLGILNSRPGRYLLHAINPTINYSLGDVRRLPLPPIPARPGAELAARVLEAEQAYNQLIPFTAPRRPPRLPPALLELEAEIDRLVCQLYHFSAADLALFQTEMP